MQKNIIKIDPACRNIIQAILLYPGFRYTLIENLKYTFFSKTKELDDFLFHLYKKLLFFQKSILMY